MAYAISSGRSRSQSVTAAGRDLQVERYTASEAGRAWCYNVSVSRGCLDDYVTHSDPYTCFHTCIFLIPVLNVYLIFG